MSKKAGIYKIINLDNDKFYIGSSSNLKSRKYKHFKDLELNKHCNTYLQSAYNKYGKDNFKWEVLEYVDRVDDINILKNNLLEREQYYLDSYESYKEDNGYNLCPTAGSRLGSKDSKETIEKRRKSCIGLKRSDEFKNKMSKILKGNDRGKFCRGYRHSEETKEKLRFSNLGKRQSKETIRKRMNSKKINNGEIKIDRKVRRLSGEHLKNLSKSHKGYKMPESQKNKIGEASRNRTQEVQDRMNKGHMKKVINLDTGLVFNSVKEAGLYYNINRGHISSVCNNKRKSAGGYKWRYYD